MYLICPHSLIGPHHIKHIYPSISAWILTVQSYAWILLKSKCHQFKQASLPHRCAEDYPLQGSSQPYIPEPLSPPGGERHPWQRQPKHRSGTAASATTSSCPVSVQTLIATQSNSCLQENLLRGSETLFLELDQSNSGLPSPPLSVAPALLCPQSIHAFPPPFLSL